MNVNVYILTRSPEATGIDAYGALPNIVEKEQKRKIIQIDPWKWLETVLEKYKQYPELIDSNDCQKFGTVYSEPQNHRLILEDSHHGLTNEPKCVSRTSSFDGENQGIQPRDNL
jgi:hypothetical protein